MKPLQFYSISEMKEMAQKIIDLRLLDNRSVANMMHFMTTSWFYEIECVKGYVVLSSVDVGRDVFVTIWVDDKVGDKYRDMIEECRQGIKYIFDRCKFKRMQANIDDKNRPSKILARHIGFKFEGLLRNSSVVDEEVKNMAVFSLTEEDIDEWIRSECSPDESGAGELSESVRRCVGAADEPAEAGIPRPDQCPDEPVERHGWWHALWHGGATAARDTGGE